MQIQGTCPVCQSGFQAVWGKVYCSLRCKEKAERIRRRTREKEGQGPEVGRQWVMDERFLQVFNSPDAISLTAMERYMVERTNGSKPILIRGCLPIDYACGEGAVMTESLGGGSEWIVWDKRNPDCPREEVDVLAMLADGAELLSQKTESKASHVQFGPDGMPIMSGKSWEGIDMSKYAQAKDSEQQLPPL